MTKIRQLYAFLIVSAAFLLAGLGAIAGAWFGKRGVTSELRQRDDELRRQQAALNDSAAKAALDKLRQDIEGTNADARNAGANALAAISRGTR